MSEHKAFFGVGRISGEVTDAKSCLVTWHSPNNPDMVWGYGWVTLPEGVENPAAQPFVVTHMLVYDPSTRQKVFVGMDDPKAQAEYMRLRRHGSLEVVLHPACCNMNDEAQFVNKALGLPVREASLTAACP